MRTFRPGLHDNIVAGAECQQAVRRKHFAPNADIALKRIDCAFFGDRRNRETPAGFYPNICISVSACWITGDFSPSMDPMISRPAKSLSSITGRSGALV